jgi:hypothetical protein
MSGLGLRPEILEAMSEDGGACPWSGVRQEANAGGAIMKYVMLIMNTPDQAKLSEEENSTWYTEVFAWYEKWGATGKLESGHQLQGPETAKTIRGSSVTDGPFIETKEVLGGYSVIDAETYDEAVDVAKSWPGVDRGLITIELRPVLPM